MKLFVLYRLWLVVFLCTITSGFLFSQTDSLHQHLPEITIIENKQTLLQPSKKQLLIDSTVLKLYQTAALPELLNTQSPIYIKSYGNGNIATTSIRGGNAGQTAVLWNGLNIQNPLLGQTDLSLLPTFLFENIAIQFGGGSALNGSGAMGGSIMLQNNTTFNNGFSTKLTTSLGSFDTRKLTVATILSYKKINSTTRVYYTASENNYHYKDTLDKLTSEKTLSHAHYSTKGLLQELSFLVKNHQHINARIWYNQTFRNLPSYSALVSKQTQADENIKINVDWNYRKNQLKSIVRLGYFNDVINYTDSTASIFSKSTVNTWVGESDNSYRIKKDVVNFTVNAANYSTHSGDYDGLKMLQKLAFILSYKGSVFKQRLLYNLSARKEYTNLTTIPITANMGVLYQPCKIVGFKLNANKSFRQPTLNDLYWKQGGNPLLKPEESYEVEGAIILQYGKNSSKISIEGTYFNKHTTNWIIWLPNSTSYWSPQNIAKVYSRGFETAIVYTYEQKKYLVKFNLNTAYILATNEQSKFENDNSVGKQLIYTPRYTGNANVSLATKKWSLLISQNYVGYRFTSSDNSSWLMPYYLTNCKVSYVLQAQQTTFTFFASVNNMFNKNYAVVDNRYMPLRNAELGISIGFKKKKD